MVTQSDWLRYRGTPTPEQRVEQLEGFLEYEKESLADARDEIEHLQAFIKSTLTTLHGQQRAQAEKLLEL
jgi:hypothetical protein